MLDEADGGIKKMIKAVEFILIGAASYWIPDILIHWLNPRVTVWIALLTLLAPAVSGLTWCLLSVKERYKRSPASFPLLMLLGIWIFGPLAMAVGVIPAGGKFLTAEALPSFLSLWAVSPLSTWAMSLYSGSLGGIVIVTLTLLIAAAFNGLKHRKIL